MAAANTPAASTGRHTISGLVTSVCTAAALYFDVPEAVAVPVCGFVGGLLGGLWRRLTGDHEDSDAPRSLRR